MSACAKMMIGNTLCKGSAPDHTTISVPNSCSQINVLSKTSLKPRSLPVGGLIRLSSILDRKAIYGQSLELTPCVGLGICQTPSRRINFNVQAITGASQAGTGAYWRILTVGKKVQTEPLDFNNEKQCITSWMHVGWCWRPKKTKARRKPFHDVNELLVSDRCLRTFSTKPTEQPEALDDSLGSTQFTRELSLASIYQGSGNVESSKSFSVDSDNLEIDWNDDGTRRTAALPRSTQSSNCQVRSLQSSGISIRGVIRPGRRSLRSLSLSSVGSVQGQGINVRVVLRTEQLSGQ